MGLLCNDLLLNNRIFSSGSGSEAVNDMINSYVASADGNISVGDLCEFVSGANTVRKCYSSSYTGSNKTLKSLSVGIGYIHAIPLDSTRVFIVWSYSSTVYGAVFSVASDGTFTIGTSTTLLSGGDTVAKPHLMSANKVLVSCESTTSPYPGKAFVCTISGTTITPGTAVTTFANYTNDCNDVTQLSDTLFVAVRSYRANTDFSVIAFTVVGSTITVGTELVIKTTEHYMCDVVALDDYHVVAVGQYSSVTADTTTIAYVKVTGTSCTLMDTASMSDPGNATNGLGYPHVFRIDDNIALVISGKNGSVAGYAYKFIDVSSGEIVTNGSSGNINDTNGTDIFRVIKLDDSHLFLVSRTLSSNYYLVGLVLTISKDSGGTYSISQGTEVVLWSVGMNGYVDAVKTSDNVVTVFCSDQSSDDLVSVDVYIDPDYNISVTPIHYKLPNPQMIALENVASGASGKFALCGIVDGLSGLIPGATYYASATDSVITVTKTFSRFRIGVALSTTQLLIDKPYWERLVV